MTTIDARLYAPSSRRAGAAGWTAALIAITAVWGSTFVVVGEALDGLPVLTFLAYRFLAAGVLLGWACRRSGQRLGRDGLRRALLTGACLWAGYALQTFGLAHTTASKAGFITGLFVVITPLLGAVVLRRRAGGLVWAGAAASTLGLVLLSGVGGELSPLGDGLVLLCAVAFSAHLLLTDAAVGRVPLLPFVTVQVLVCGGVSLLGAGALGQLEVPREPSTWAAIAVTAVLASAVGFMVQAQAQRRLPPARTALVLSLEPAFAGLSGYLLAGDRLTAAGWAGAALMFASLVAVEALPRLRAHAAPS